MANEVKKRERRSRRRRRRRRGRRGERLGVNKLQISDSERLVVVVVVALVVVLELIIRHIYCLCFSLPRSMNC